MDIDYTALIEEHKDLIESMAWVALSKIRRPSAYSLEDLCQEGAFVCLEWVKRWYDPTRGASLKTFITGGLRNHFADIVRQSFRDYPENLEKQEADLRKRSTECSPFDMAVFNETFRTRLTAQQQQYIVLFLSAAQAEPNPREVVRQKMDLSMSAEETIRKDIRERLST